MKTSFNFKTSVAVAALVLMGAAQGAQTNHISKAAYKEGKDRISADYKANKDACKSMTGNAKDICMEEAKAKEKVASAELEYSYTGKTSDQAKIDKVKAETTYAVAKEKCDDQTGNAKDVCVKEAKAAQTKVLADLKMNKKVSEAKTEDMKDKRDADYKVAAEKCDAMSGDAKASCIAAAKAKFGKS